MRFQSKLPQVGTTIFTVMSGLAAQYNAINLGQGFPDFDMPPELVALVTEAMKAGYNQYTHMAGYLPLRESIAEKVNASYGCAVNADTQITVTPGGTYAIYTALTTILQPGDEVIVFEPAYDCYIPAIEVAGAKAITIPLLFPDYKIDWGTVAQKITERTRAIIINSPHNPTGAVLREQDMGFLKSLVRDTNMIIISDEVYEHLIFDGIQHQSILRDAELAARSFACFSFGKVYHCTGWKLGYVIAAPGFTTEFRKIHQYNAFSCDTPKQVALAQYLKKKETYLELGAFLQQKRDLFQTLMQGTAFKPVPSYGSYFQLYSYEGISHKSEKEFAIELTKNAGVTAIPVSAFYKEETNNKVLRFCFAKKEETLKAAAERLLKL
ncbi:MAG TPA: methionine aminotransferase [Chitinophagaceae bacterium]|nr:methionine aminotransferase [Chitinophagaceae bacterium]